MKPKAIIYTSNTGYTKQYAQLLHQNIQLPLYSLSNASKCLPEGELFVNIKTRRLFQ